MPWKIKCIKICDIAVDTYNSISNKIWWINITSCNLKKQANFKSDFFFNFNFVCSGYNVYKSCFYFLKKRSKFLAITSTFLYFMFMFWTSYILGSGITTLPPLRVEKPASLPGSRCWDSSGWGFLVVVDMRFGCVLTHQVLVFTFSTNKWFSTLYYYCWTSESGVTHRTPPVHNILVISSLLLIDRPLKSWISQLLRVFKSWLSLLLFQNMKPEVYIQNLFLQVVIIIFKPLAFESWTMIITTEKWHMSEC